MNGGFLTSWESLCESCAYVCRHNTHIQAGYPEPCKIPGSNSCKAFMCLLNSMPQHRWLPLGHWPSFQLGSRVWQINEAIARGNGRQASLLTEAVASCLFIMSEVLNHGFQDPKRCWFPV